MDSQESLTQIEATPGWPTAGRRREILLVAVAVALLAGWLLWTHHRLNVGWGAELVHQSGRQYAYGIAFNETDNLSYVAWAQQAAQGRYPFRDLYTTEPHAALLINPYFLLVGRVAALFSIHPIAVMNVAGLLAALLTVAFVYLAGRAMGLSRRGGAFAAGLIAWGAGLSGSFYIINALLGTHLPTEWTTGFAEFPDLVPSRAFLGFPYHTIGLMLVAALLYGVVAAERRLLEGRRAGLALALTGAGALALTATRPYEPIAFAACYGLYLAAAWWRRKAPGMPSSPQPDAPAGRRSPFAARLRIFAVLLAGMGPFILYSFWVSRQQPVWASFADQSLDLHQGRRFWLLLFGLFWPGALAGLWLRRSGQPLYLGLPGLWALFLLVCFVGCDASCTKLASGGFLALGILSGHACDRLLARTQRLAGGAARMAALAGFMILLISTALGTLVHLREDVPGRPGEDLQALRCPVVDREMLALARLAVQSTPGGAPLILTDCWTGSLLPGLTGARVYAGHWSLTVRFREKVAELLAAGLEWTPRVHMILLGAPQPAPLAPARALDALLGRAPFDFVLVPRRCPGYSALLAHPRLRVARSGADWTLFAASPR